MKSFNASLRLSSGALAAVLVLAVPTAASFTLKLETDSPTSQTTIEEWHWRDMAF